MAATSIESLVTCSICFEVFTKPKTLPCDHSFCLHCLAKIAAVDITDADVPDTSRGLKITCPICKAPFFYDTVSEVKESLILKQLIDAHSPCPEELEGIKCSCSKLATLRCLDCITSKCKSCLQLNDNNCIKNHFVCKIGKYESSEYLCLHHEIGLDYYCKDCGTPACIDCCFTSHPDHMILTVTSQAKSHEKYMQSYKDLLVRYNSSSEGIKFIHLNQISFKVVILTNDETTASSHMDCYRNEV